MQQSFDSIVRHRRPVSAIAAALLRASTYAGAIKAFQLCNNPVDFLLRYVRNGGTYPATIQMRTPIGVIPVNVYSPDDVQTINEIFLRGDYDTPTAAKTVVDFGSNIGISALFFLSRRRDAFVYCFEPLAMNTERLKKNLATFGDRYRLAEIAVGESDTTVSFGWEPTGRYGGVGCQTGQMIEVPCRDSNAILREIVDRDGGIDLVKIDIETLEKAVTERIPDDLRPCIKDIVVEYPFKDNPLAATHASARRHNVTAFHRQ